MRIQEAWSCLRSAVERSSLALHGPDTIFGHLGIKELNHFWFPEAFD